MGILSILVKLGVDAAKFEMDLKKVQSLGEKFGTSFKSAISNKLGQAFAASSVVAFTKHLMNSADEITDLAQQLNITTDEVQRLQILSSETGVSFERLTYVLTKFEDARLKATSGDKDAIKTLEDLGLTIDQLNNAQLSHIQLAVKGAENHKLSGQSAKTLSSMIELYGTKWKIAGAALAEYQSTENRGLISKENLDAISKGNSLFDEQIRQLKALASKPLADGIMAVGDAIKYLNDQNTGLAKTFNAKATSAQLGATYFGANPMSAAGFAAASLNPESPKTPAAVNPPAIGTPQFERVKGDKISLGGSQDSLTRIGGFTGFQSTQDKIAKNALDQTIQLKMIVKHTGKTADHTKD
jgi:hypothetical protein